MTIRLWPSGQSGLAYDFRANPRGVHYQASSENVNFAPAWTSLAQSTTDGYVITMLIPLKTMRSDGRAEWGAQFERDIKVGNERDEWAHAPGQATTDQATYAGRLSGMSVLAKAARTAARAGIYVLSQGASSASGGSTSRAGADLSIPLTSTTSLVAAIHPDFSTVETDQQTISPTTFNRSYKEVRPFFAQGASFYDQSACYGCAGWLELYTPSIPTPRDGYQLEGKQGPFTFGALDAVGVGRIDTAQALNWTSTGNVFNLGYTRVGSDRPGLHDVTNFTSLRFNDQHAIVGYLETGVEQGTTVTDDRKARRFDGGIAYQTRDDFIAYTMRSVGSQWNPADGFTSVNDVAGYSAQINHTFHLSGTLRTIVLFEYEDHYAGSDGFGTNLIDTENQATFTFANNFSASGFFGTSAYRVPSDPTLHPANYQGARVDYLLNTPLQSTFNYQAGHYGDGWIVVIDRIAGFRLAKRATMSPRSLQHAMARQRHAQQSVAGSRVADLRHRPRDQLHRRRAQADRHGSALSGPRHPHVSERDEPVVRALTPPSARRLVPRLRRSEHARHHARGHSEIRALLRCRPRHLISAQSGISSGDS